MTRPKITFSFSYIRRYLKPVQEEKEVSKANRYCIFFSCYLETLTIN